MSANHSKSRLLLALLFATGLLAQGCEVSEAEPEPEPEPDHFDPTKFDPAVEFSHPGGFYKEGFDLVLHALAPGQEIRYTLDGSEPTNEAKKYSKPIRITSRVGEENGISEIPTNHLTEGSMMWRPPRGEVFKATVVRARAWDFEDGKPGPISTMSYFVGDELASRYPLPVVSLALPPDGFFHDEYGIYVPGNSFHPEDELSGNYYTLNGRDSEVRSNFELFESKGRPALNFIAGIRIHGAFSRRIPQKSLRLYLRNDYQLKLLDYPLFPDKENTRYKRFLLRNSGNDWAFTLIIDSLGLALARGTRIDRQFHRAALVFINGEYWGIQQFRDRLDAHHFSNHYSIPREEVVVINNHKELAEGTDADLSEYLSFMNSIGDQGVQSESEYLSLLMQLDIDILIDYHALNIYAGNHDWPFNNVKAWRRRIMSDLGQGFGKDGRWRFAMYDFDHAFGWYTDRISRDTMAHALDPDVRGTAFLRGLLSYPHFQQRFLLRFSDLLNTRFKGEEVVALVNELADEISTSMPEHINRWNNFDSLEQWEANIRRQRNFAELRPSEVRGFLGTHFGVSQWHLLRVGAVGEGRGFFRLNDHLTIPHTERWESMYPEDLGLKLRAHPLPGSCFAGWEGPVQQSSPLLKIQLKHDTIRYKARFLRKGDSACLSDPVPHPLADSDYILREWSDLEPAGAQPPSMLFKMGLAKDETLADSKKSTYRPCSYDGGYNLEAGTRVSGHGELGLSVVNTGSTAHCGFVDSVVLSVDSRNVEQLRLSFTAGTLAQNSRIHGFRLQYRVGSDGSFHDILDINGDPVDYLGTKTGDSKYFEQIQLPEALNNHPEVQLRWKYYYSGARLNRDSGARSQLRLDDIELSARRGP